MAILKLSHITKLIDAHKLIFLDEPDVLSGDKNIVHLFIGALIFVITAHHKYGDRNTIINNGAPPGFSCKIVHFNCSFRRLYEKKLTNAHIGTFGKALVRQNETDAGKTNGAEQICSTLH